MKYAITIQKGNDVKDYTIIAKDLVNLYKKINKLVSDNIIYEDEVVDVRKVA